MESTTITIETAVKALVGDMFTPQELADRLIQISFDYAETWICASEKDQASPMDNQQACFHIHVLRTMANNINGGITTQKHLNT